MSSDLQWCLFTAVGGLFFLRVLWILPSSYSSGRRRRCRRYRMSLVGFLWAHNVLLAITGTAHAVALVFWFSQPARRTFSTCCENIFNVLGACALQLVVALGCMFFTSFWRLAQDSAQSLCCQSVCWSVFCLAVHVAWGAPIYERLMRSCLATGFQNCPIDFLLDSPHGLEGLLRVINLLQLALSALAVLSAVVHAAAVHVEAASDRLGCLPTLLTSLADLFALPAAPVGCIPHDISLTDLGHLIALLLAVAPLVVALSLFVLPVLALLLLPASLAVGCCGRQFTRASPARSAPPRTCQTRRRSLESAETNIAPPISYRQPRATPAAVGRVAVERREPLLAAADARSDDAPRGHGTYLNGPVTAVASAGPLAPPSGDAAARLLEQLTATDDGSDSTLFGDGEPPLVHSRRAAGPQGRLAPSRSRHSAARSDLPQIGENSPLAMPLPQHAPVSPRDQRSAASANDVEAGSEVDVTGGGSDESLPPSGGLVALSASSLQHATEGFAQDRVLGSGGFGCVYRCESVDGIPAAAGALAVKQLAPDSAQGVTELLNEIQILGACGHPHLLPLFGFCLEPTCRCLVFSLMLGGSLHDRRFFSADAAAAARLSQLGMHAPSPLTWVHTLRILAQVASAIVYLHTPTPNGKPPLLHRDVKPENILLNGRGDAKLADVGLAKAANELQRGASAVFTTSLVGTPGYIDPLYMNGGGRVATMTDGYAFGVTALVCLTGQPAVLPGGSSLLEACAALLDDPTRAVLTGWPDPAALWPDAFARKLAEVIASLVCRMRHERATPNDAARRLQGLAEAAAMIYRDGDGEVVEEEEGNEPAAGESALARPSVLVEGVSEEGVTSTSVAEVTSLRECVVCLSEPRAVRFAPCGHAVCCAECGDELVRRVRPCPACRAPIASVAERGAHVGAQETFRGVVP